MSDIFFGLKNVLLFSNLAIISLGTLFGIAVGAMPGLSATMGVALLVPITFKMDPATGLCMLGAVYCGAVYGGSITAILLRTPGTPGNITTSWDGYEMTKKGLAGKALGISTVSSFIGGTFSALALLLIAPPLADFSLRFGPPERFLLAVFGITIIVSLCSEYPIKGFIAGVLGIVLATTGIDLAVGDLRYTFGQLGLFDGIPELPSLIGLVSMSQAILIIEKNSKKIQITQAKVRDRILPTIEDYKKIWKTILRSSIIGTIIGIIPGAGTTTASFISYNEAKRSSKDKDFGKGSIVALSSSESSNNAVTGGSLVPLLTLGIPGNAVSAIFLGGLLIHGLIPGPELFTKYGEITYTLMISLFFANIALLIFGLLGAKLFVNVAKVETNILSPLIITLSVLGSFAMRNNIFDVFLMFCFGIIGYAMEKNNFPTAPMILGIILGPIAESELRRSLSIFRGNLLPIFLRPISAIFIILIIYSLYISFKKIMAKKS
ncbi:MAG TPA: C4-dicarboxylate ABC transporter permease [Candidatus Atribacteria bacterium]|nr:C4-dicarboxylate ABC transporter permease [Candidatus Atribacteria bacterium]